VRRNEIAAPTVDTLREESLKKQTFGEFEVTAINVTWLALLTSAKISYPEASKTDP